MKKILLTTLAIFISATALAQIPVYKQGAPEGVTGYALPRTVITVTVTQEREVIIRGPYARYAAKYLGVLTVPMNDKESYRLISSEISFSTEPDPAEIYAMSIKKGDPTMGLDWITSTVTETRVLNCIDRAVNANLPLKDLSLLLAPVDRGTSSLEKSAEQMAAEAADAIYRIRRKRVELITGDIGEATYGAGLKDALKEMDRLEEEYTALFTGRRHVEVTTKQFSVLPEMSKDRITAFRFNDTKGAVPVSDLSGRPINLELTTEGIAPASNKQSGRVITYRVPQVSIVKLTDGQTVLTTQRVPIYQNGNYISVPVL